MRHHPDGTQLADERESLLWGFVNMLDSQTQRLDRAADKLMPELRDLQREQDGTEIKSRELELVTDRAQNLTARRDAFETMRDAAAPVHFYTAVDTEVLIVRDRHFGPVVSCACPWLPRVFRRGRNQTICPRAHPPCRNCS